MSKDLTDRQREIFDFIKEIISGSGFPPTIREIGNRFEISVKGAYDHLKAIEKKGYLRCTQNKSRAIELLTECELQYDDNTIRIPLLGTIAAGAPLLAEENIEDYLSLPGPAFSSGQFFGLRVRGDSMIDEGIFDGDIAVIRKQETAINGEIIAALIGDEATLKTFSKKDGTIRLLPANENYEPIVPKELVILGKLAGLFRIYRKG
ncbi:MAG: transcriptional repressor LexA [Spirochaetes bacterium]|nr:transcriptional repressor LexA [Spirochaetota bacterium]MBN2770210.1 transcriptional repressor LexA [Spirochaetota bacterium]